MKYSGIISFLFSSNQTVYFISHVIDKIKKLEANLPPPTGDPLEHLKKVMEGRQCEFSLKLVHPLEVEEIVKNLK